MPRNARTVGDRVEELLAGLRAGRDKDAAEELVRLLVEMYGDALERVVGIAHERDPALVDRFVEDDLVESLLLVHDLHPLDVDTRVQRALDRVRPYLGSHAGGVDYLGVDDEGVARLRLRGNCDGCPSSLLTVQQAIEGAIQDAAPELNGVAVDGVADQEPSPLLQVGMGPPPGWVAGSGAERTGWTTLPETGPPTGRATRLEVDGTPVLVCSVRGTLYAYRDACGACGASLAGATVDDGVLGCPACGDRFDVQLAGRGVDENTHRLAPVPLLSDSRGTRVAVPKAVLS